MDRNDIRFCYPNWAPKAVTFSIDDGHNVLDKKFMSYVKPAGIKGTFNLTGREPSPSPDYPQMYEDYGIANHCKAHPFALTEDKKHLVVNEPYDGETAKDNTIYPRDERGLYFFRINKNMIWPIAEIWKYIELIDKAQRELEEIFGKGRIRDFVWPFGKQRSPELIDYINSHFYSCRNSNVIKDTFGYEVPPDKNDWSITAGWSDLVDQAKKFAALEDDSKLRFFCIGMHSHDYENNNSWESLEFACNLFGNQPDKYYSDDVDGLFDYSDAVNAVKFIDGKPVNESGIDIWMKVNGKKAILEKKSSYIRWID